MMTIFEYSIKIIIVDVIEDITEARQFPITVPSSLAPPNKRLSKLPMSAAGQYPRLAGEQCVILATEQCI